MDRESLLKIIDRPRKVALYASLTCDGLAYISEVHYERYDEHYQLLPEGQRRERPAEGSVRVTEPVEVNFAAIDNDSMTANAIASLDEEERKLYEELNKKLVRLRDFKNQLLALTHKPETA